MMHGYRLSGPAPRRDATLPPPLLPSLSPPPLTPLPILSLFPSPHTHTERHGPTPDVTQLHAADAPRGQTKSRTVQRKVTDGDREATVDVGGGAGLTQNCHSLAGLL